MSPGSRPFRKASLVSLAALALHQLRYQAGYGDHAHEALADHGHSYLPLLLALVLTLCVAAAVGLLVTLTRAARGGARQPGPVSIGRTWLGISALLIALYAGQELIEGALFAGHPNGLEGVIGEGGWVAVLIAPAHGALVAVLLRAADAAIALATGGLIALAYPSIPSFTSSLSPLASRAGALALNRAWRAPPASCI
jgi:hypothetical protein